MYSLLIIDDEEKHRGLLARLLAIEGYKISQAGTALQAWKHLEQDDTDLVICDVKLPDAYGVDLIKEIKTKYPQTEIILLTAYGNIPDGVQAIKNGAFDYIVKGDDNDKIVPLLSRAAEKVDLQQKVKRLQSQLNKKYSFDSIIGQTLTLREAIKLAKKVAPTDAAVLLTGKTGTGKEVFASAIHYESLRAANPFVALNCSAFSKEILESELFGHKAGAFTGAIKDKKGMIEEAKNGTLFLDEIGEIPLELQAKLLRVLEDGSYYRVGDTKQYQANIRLVAATNRNLLEEINIGHFRSDLYYRIAVFTIELPTLRERINDIPLLAKHYLEQFSIKTNKSITSISKEAMHALQNNEWRGNVRELKNVIERAVILEDTNTLSITSLPFELQETIARFSSNGSLSAFHLASVEKLHIQKVLNYAGGNKAETARLLNIGLATLYRKIEEYQLKS
ncbi:MAG TPA: sigma-54 dependent transcriptional regulator [Flavipsychrobacter sp.]|nr:sigma-54 dependent transcriptional regulator [Flavipsychrobacter sp.]